MGVGGSKSGGEADTPKGGGGKGHDDVASIVKAKEGAQSLLEGGAFAQAEEGFVQVLDSVNALTPGLPGSGSAGALCGAGRRITLEALLGRAAARKGLEDVGGALEDWEKVLALDPANESAKAALAQAESKKREDAPPPTGALETGDDRPSSVEAAAPGQSSESDVSPWERGWEASTGFVPPTTPGSRGEDAAGDEETKEESSSSQEQRNFDVPQLGLHGGKRVPCGRDGEMKLNLPILLALKGNVYDVSQAADLYAEGGKYHYLAGHDATRCLALCSTKEADLDDLDLDVETLTRQQQLTLRGWEETFATKEYPVVGRLIPYPLPKGTLPRLYDRSELSPFTGLQPTRPVGWASPPILMGVKDTVFDVSFGLKADLYLPGGPYACLAGRDASRVLAKMSMKQADVEGLLDYASLTQEEQVNIDDWEKKLRADRRYPVIGKLSLPGL